MKWGAVCLVIAWRGDRWGFAALHPWSHLPHSTHSLQPVPLLCSLLQLDPTSFISLYALTSPILTLVDALIPFPREENWGTEYLTIVIQSGLCATLCPLLPTALLIHLSQTPFPISCCCDSLLFLLQVTGSPTPQARDGAPAEDSQNTLYSLYSSTQPPDCNCLFIYLPSLLIVTSVTAGNECYLLMDHQHLICTQKHLLYVCMYVWVGRWMGE